MTTQIKIGNIMQTPSLNSIGTPTFSPSCNTEFVKERDNEPSMFLHARRRKLNMVAVVLCVLLLAAICTLVVVKQASSTKAYNFSTGDGINSPLDAIKQQMAALEILNRAGASGDAGSTPTLDHCPQGRPGDRLVMFWQTEIASNCSAIPVGVTHVIWAFALVGNGTSMLDTNNIFQGYQSNIKNCIAELHKRCIFSLASVGGETNKDFMATITDPQKFAKSVLALLEQYEFDGVDIDDESVGEEFDAARVEAYMKALHTLLKTGGNKYFITFDGLPHEADDEKCRQIHPGRCYATGVTEYVDWIHIMAYNFDRNPQIAETNYQEMHNVAFPRWEAKIGKDKLTAGICVAAACAYGPGPTLETIQEWKKYSLSHGGLMVYAGSLDVLQDYHITRTIVDLGD